MSTSQARIQSDLPVTQIQSSTPSTLGLKELWDYRELLYFLVWRDVKVRYKQTVIGAAWTVIQPLLTIVIFTVVFQHFAKLPSDGVPYPLFSFTGLLPWNYFAKALNNGINSVVGSANLITKVYFPRLILPISAILSGLIDFGISFLCLLGMMIWYGLMPGWGVLALPLFLLLAVLTALSVGLWLAVINVRYRDVGQAIPFLIQLWLFVSPVAYPLSLVPEKWRVLYSLNPMTGVIEGFRWALLGKPMLDILPIAISIVVVLALLFAGIRFFRRMEETFADVV
jgi:homopolymeric O-antigen transport system permease protein